MPTLYYCQTKIDDNAHSQSLDPTLKLSLKFTHFFRCYLMCILLSPSGDYVWRLSILSLSLIQSRYIEKPISKALKRYDTNNIDICNMSHNILDIFDPPLDHTSVIDDKVNVMMIAIVVVIMCFCVTGRREKNCAK